MSRDLGTIRSGLGVSCHAVTVVVLSCGGVGAAENGLPPQVDLSPVCQQRGFTARNQGNRADCSLFAVTGLAEFEAAHTAAPPYRLSVEFLIWATDTSTGQRGDQAMFYKAVQGLNTYGVCDEQHMPYVGKPKLRHQPTQDAIDDARRLRERWQVKWIKRWSVDRELTEPELIAIKRNLAHRHPVACGLRWPKESEQASLLHVPPPSKVFDGHSIMLVGYEDDPRKAGGGIFKFRNSAGPNWGQQGYGYLSYAYALAYANDALSLHLGPDNSEIPAERYEVESLPVIAAANCTHGPQSMKDWGPKMWSQGRQLFCNAKRGGTVTLAFVVHKPGRYRVRLLATAAPDYGEIRAALNGAASSHAFDLYAGQVCPAGSLELGTHQLGTGRHTLQFTVVAKNPASKGFSFGLDALDLIAAK